ncbi:hypothetical protein, partial [Erythrobacter donghaensis]|uniref:hypothetical protein n=1 Tax=Erythrobacter donghaensis TaxID=267135 RepID=UPI003F4AE898
MGILVSFLEIRIKRTWQPITSQPAYSEACAPSGILRQLQGTESRQVAMIRSEPVHRADLVAGGIAQIGEIQLHP